MPTTRSDRGARAGRESRAGNGQPRSDEGPGLSVKRRFGLVLGVVLGLFLTATAVTVYAFSLIVGDFSEEVRTVYDEAIPLLELQEAVFVLSEIHAWDVVFAITGGSPPQARATYDAQVARVDARFRSYLSNRSSMAPDELEHVEAALSEWIVARDSHEAILGGAAATPSDMAEEMSHISVLLHSVTNRLGSAYDLASRELDIAHDAVRRTQLLAALLIGGIFLIGLAVVALTARSLSRFVVQPIRVLQEAARRLRRGDLSHRVHPTGSSELIELGVAFNKMADSVDRTNAALEHRALHDDLTGLANRVLLRDRIDHARSIRGPFAAPYALVLIDLDRFKTVNDRFGHSYGDAVLVEAASRIRITARNMDTVARLGGDEFAVFLEHVTGIEQVAHVADRITAGLSRPYEIDGTEIFVGASTGISFSSSQQDSDTLLHNADLAMYAAKARGGNAFQIFQPEPSARDDELPDLTTELRGVPDRNET